MKIGSLVECIEGYPGAISCNCYPVKKGDILTVRDIGIYFSTHYGKGYTPIVFEEHKNPLCACGCGCEMHYDAEDFREIQPPIEIKIESLISETQTV